MEKLTPSAAMKEAYIATGMMLDHDCIPLDQHPRDVIEYHFSGYSLRYGASPADLETDPDSYLQRLWDQAGV